MIRTILKLAAVAVAAMTFSSQALAQNTKTEGTTGTATIAAPITITEGTALVFGGVTRPTTGSNTVSIDSGNNCTRAISGGGDGALVSSTTSCATYTVGGESGQAFNITNDATFDMTHTNGTDKLTVTLNKSATTGTVGQATAAFKVGGSFPVATTTPAGAYSGTFNVTVTYQ